MRRGIYMALRITNELLINDVQQLSREIGGYAPHPGKFKRASTAVHRFGSWRNFINAAQIPATYFNKSTYYTVEEIDYKMEEIIDQGEKNFTWQQLLRKYKLPMKLIQTYYGSLQIFLYRYGVDKYQSYRRVITINDIKEVYKKLSITKHKPTEKEVMKVLGFADTHKITDVLKANGYCSFWDFKEGQEYSKRGV